MAVTKNMLDALHRGSKILLNLAAVLGVICALVAVVAIVWGVRPIVFSTNSMSPSVPAGSLAFTIPVDSAVIAPGDIVSAQRLGDGKLVTHRVVSVDHKESNTTLIMRGDANSSNDAAPYDVSDGAQKVIWHIPHAGGLVTVFQSPWIIGGALALLVIALIPNKKDKDRAVEKTPPS
ncbi:signal peptidase I [Leucobacter coleopterorum]|uniref:Signal peptidase I n=1 Tax=Leucobacter coleopterorum TaxID=2714933 RepID=A0ABX6JXK9_9MICO|nr:signal peptidase I [Leucobacter coleopterorum]QIM19045.1 signal peptidase I [Leucobacter coleopterorum]